MADGRPSSVIGCFGHLGVARERSEAPGSCRVPLRPSTAEAQASPDAYGQAAGRAFGSTRTALQRAETVFIWRTNPLMPLATRPAEMLRGAPIGESSGGLRSRQRQEAAYSRMRRPKSTALPDRATSGPTARSCAPAFRFQFYGPDAVLRGARIPRVPADKRESGGPAGPLGRVRADSVFRGREHKAPE